MLESGCLGYPVHCGHCGAIFSSGFDLSQHLNVGGGLTRSVPFPAYTTIYLSSFVSLNSVFPAAVSFCPSNISSVSSANSFPFRPDHSEDYLYLFFLHNVVNSSYSTPELQPRFDSMEASFRSYLVAQNYPQALEACVGDLLLSHFVHLINLVGERDRNLPSS